MIITWDSHKANSNFRKHGITFEQAAQVFNDPLMMMAFDRIEGGEERWHSIGRVDNQWLVVVVHTLQFVEDSETVRIISARRAEKAEIKHYERHQI